MHENDLFTKLLFQKPQSGQPPLKTKLIHKSGKFYWLRHTFTVTAGRNHTPKLRVGFCLFIFIMFAAHFFIVLFFFRERNSLSPCENPFSREMKLISFFFFFFPPFSCFRVQSLHVLWTEREREATLDSVCEPLKLLNFFPIPKKIHSHRIITIVFSFKIHTNKFIPKHLMRNFLFLLFSARKWKISSSFCSLSLSGEKDK